MRNLTIAATIAVKTHVEHGKDRTIKAVQQGKDVIMGIHLQNLMQSVNSGHIINTSMIQTPGKVITNKPGWTLEVTGDVRSAHKRIDMQPISPDIYVLQQMFTQEGQDASGVQDIIEGKSEGGAETLGENELIMDQASLRMNALLRSFEETGVQPFYEMRNQINMQFIDAPYAYMVLDEAGREWRTIEPGQIRANVDFICESSSRESSRMVISQQILQLLKLSPSLKMMGFPVRIDLLASKLCEKGFSWGRQEIEAVFPSLKLPKEHAAPLLGNRWAERPHRP